MSYEVYRYIFYGGAILSVIMLALTIILFFVYKIPNVIGDLTGANAKKAIENIRNQNENSGNKLYKSSAINRERGRITDKMTPSGSLIKDNNHYFSAGAMSTEKISTSKLSSANSETTVLDVSNETTVLSNKAEETTILSFESGETTVLEGSNSGPAFQIEYEITYIHTHETIS